MRIASYNLYEGAQDTYSQLQEFVAEQNPDVLCLQEANGWDSGTPSRLEEFGETTGLPHYVFGNSNTRFKLATFSRLPLLASEVVTDGFWHSAVRTTVGYKDDALDVWNVHLNPRGEDERVKEIARLIALTDTNRPTVITGDFNSLSALDQYPDEMLSVLATQGITKFGVDRLRFDVTERLTRAGFVDAANELISATNTVPTPANKDMYHATEMRLDYMFVTKVLARSLGSVHVPKNLLTDVISDHYPLVVDFE